MIKFMKMNWTKFIISMSICLMAILSLFFTCKTYAYTIDSNGNLVGDNLWSYQDSMTNTNVGITATLNGSILDLNGTNTGTGGWLFQQSIPLNISSGTYTLKYYGITSNYGFALNLYDSNNNNIVDVGYVTEFTFTINTDITSCSIWITGNGFTYDNQKIKIMINEGTTSQEWEPYGVWYSSVNYETLENQLNTTNGLLDLQIDITKYGWLSYIDNLEYYVTGSYVDTFTFEQLKTNNYISNNATLDLYTMSLYQNPNYSYIKFDIYFQNSYANLDYFSANLFDISTKLGFNGVVSIYDTDSNSAVFNITDIASITYEDIIEKNSNFGDYIYNVVFEFASPDASTMIYTNSFYSRGYQTGYSYGSNVTTGYYTPIINDLNARISNLENDIVSLNNTIDTLKELNAQYQQQLADNVGWSSLFFAFADTPFKVVSNVLGFELFGLNLFATFIGMITVFGVVYLLKKFL